MCLFKKKKDVTGLFTAAVDNNYTFVDLGLSVKWANKNVGAETPEQVGCYFNYDETESRYHTLPTVDEVRELFEKCKIKYDKKRNGFDVVGVNGNNIFIPIGGEMKGNDHYEGAYFWTNSDHEEEGYMPGYKYYGCVYLRNKYLKNVKTEVNLLKRDGFWINVREVERG